MSQQGTYPIGVRTLTGSDTLTGVVTGTTADVPLSAVKTYIGGSALASALTTASIMVANAANFTVPLFVPGTLQLVAPVKTSVLAGGITPVILKDVGGVLKTAGQMMPTNQDGTGHTNYISPDQIAGTVNYSTGVITLQTTLFTATILQWNGSSFPASTLSVAFVAGPYNYTLVTA